MRLGLLNKLRGGGQATPAESVPAAREEPAVEPAAWDNAAAREGALVRLRGGAQVAAVRAPLPKSTRICVLGAGPAGLSYARRMKELGYSDVQVLERNPDVGGKCSTAIWDDVAHDMGATVGIPDLYWQVAAFAKEAGIAMPDAPPSRYIQAGAETRFPSPLRSPRLMFEGLKYTLLHIFVWKGVNGSGLENLSPELAQSWAEFVDRHGFQELNQRVSRYGVGWGYWFDDVVSAGLRLNALRMKTLVGAVFKGMFTFEGGTQNIWRGVAQDLDVRTSVQVTRVERGDFGVRVFTQTPEGEEVLEYDKLVVAFNPKKALSILDANEVEQGLFASIETVPYWTVACRIEGLEPEGGRGAGYLLDNMQRDDIGKPLTWLKTHSDSNVHVVSLYGREGLSDAELEANIRESVEQHGGRLLEVLDVRRWEFFPHPDVEAVENGFYRDVNGLQGVQNTYYTGETLSFPSMAHATENGTRVAERMATNAFPTPAP